MNQPTMTDHTLATIEHRADTALARLKGPAGHTPSSKRQPRETSRERKRREQGVFMAQFPDAESVDRARARFARYRTTGDGLTRFASQNPRKNAMRAAVGAAVTSAGMPAHRSDLEPANP